MRILIVTPASPGAPVGNNVTASRYERILSRLGHDAQVARCYDGENADLLVALHARKSAEALLRFKESMPERPAILCLTGTDVYHDIRFDVSAQRSLRLADRLITLQPLAVNELPEDLRHKARTIYQSAEPLPEMPEIDECRVCIIGNLREVKDPFRAAEAARLLPKESNLRFVHLGRAIEEGYEERAISEQAENPRYHWLGEVSPDQTRVMLAGSRAMVISSLLEGGANVVSEAVVCRVPILASNIPGNIGLLGEGYPAYFPVGDTMALCRLLLRIERDSSFVGVILEKLSSLADRFHPDAEKASWQRLLADISQNSALPGTR